MNLKLQRYVLILLFSIILVGLTNASYAEKKRPNILFCIADDWGWPHAASYGDPAVKTPAFDRLAKEGVLFEHAYVTSPSCTPCRNSILTGRWHWQLGPGASLWSTLSPKFKTWPLLLMKAGYHTGHMRKSWGPGLLEGWETPPAGPRFRTFEQFLSQKSDDEPFCFWLGASDPHRGYKLGSGKAAGISLEKIKLFGCLPDHPTIRSDVADYYFEVQRFDSDVMKAIKLLEAKGELDNTLIVMTGDHGMPFPRCKSNLYDSGTRVCLAARWGKKIKGNRRVTDFVSLMDLGPTFLEAAGVQVPKEMSGRSLMTQLMSQKAGRVDVNRDHMIFGKERHVPSQEKGNNGGYPSRAIRVDGYLYIHNIMPERWPNGMLDGKQSHLGRQLADCDNGPSKTFLIEHRTDPKYKKYYDMAFAKRPGVELFDVKKDPDQLKNLADDPAYAKVKSALAARLNEALKKAKDPRVLGHDIKFDEFPYRPKPTRKPVKKNKK